MVKKHESKKESKKASTKKRKAGVRFGTLPYLFEGHALESLLPLQLLLVRPAHTTHGPDEGKEKRGDRDKLKMLTMSSAEALVKIFQR